MTNQTKPRFSTASSTGQTLSSESFEGKVPLAMMFIPDPHEHRAALARYNDAHSELAKRRVQLLAVAPLTASEARDFAESAEITYPVLSDPALEMFRDFGAMNEGGGAMPRSVIVDKTGTVAHTTERIDSPQELMARLDALEDSTRFEMAVNR